MAAMDFFRKPINRDSSPMALTANTDRKDILKTEVSRPGVILSETIGEKDSVTANMELGIRVHNTMDTRTNRNTISTFAINILLRLPG